MQKEEMFQLILIFMDYVCYKIVWVKIILVAQRKRCAGIMFPSV